MNITLQQQYNYLNWRRRVAQIYKQQMLNESLQGSQSGTVNGAYVPAGESSSGKNKIYKLEAIDTETGHAPFLFYYESDGNYDVVALNETYKTKYLWKKGLPISKASIQSNRTAKSCSSFTHGRFGAFHARNYDWNYDSAPEVIVKIPRGIGIDGHQRFASLNIAHLNMSNKDLVDGDNKWNPQFDMLESTVMDGINEYGLSYNTNVVPVGDNPLHPTGEYEDGTPPEIRYNITYDTNLGKPLFFIRCMLRLVLDYCKNVEDAEQMILGNSWFAARKPNDDSFIEEFHLMIHDAKNDTIIVEFVENKVVIHKWNNGVYEGCISDHQRKDDLEIGSKDVLPIMTNFYVSGWNGKVESANESIDMNADVDKRNSTITKYPAGTERYLAMWKDYGYIKDINMMRDTILKAWYRKAYRTGADGRAPIDPDSTNAWWSEFLGDYSDVSKALGDFNFRCNDDLKKLFVANEHAMPRLIAQAAEEDKLFEDKDIRPAIGSALPTWQTVHSTIYDKSGEEYVMSILTQEDSTHTYTFTLPKA